MPLRPITRSCRHAGAGDLVGSGEQAAEPARQGAERRGVGSADEADRPAGLALRASGDPPLRQAEAARVDDDQRRAAGGQSLAPRR